MVKAQRPETRLEYYMKDFPNFAGLVEYNAFSMNDLREVSQVVSLETSGFH